MSGSGTQPAPSSIERGTAIADVLRRFWGFDALRPLQREAIDAGLAGRDSVVVMPTGGGKSLCYQVPPAILDRTDVVVSPLISLMKDQVDGLRECGYPAVALHSGQTSAEQRAAEEQVAAGGVRLLFLAPERLVTSRGLALLDRIGARAFAIDEAHCISHWGHDFRPEYRALSLLKERFPQASVHAYTATATPRVRADIAVQLRLREPVVLVGDFDRPNLTYRVVPKLDEYAQVLEVVKRHRREAVIVYCISRRETEDLGAFLSASGIRAAHYHAGLEKDLRRQTQDRFAEEKLDVVVATVAFGMGIDRSDVRCVIHTSIPKSVEHYQQETGRAGRDSLPAECVLLYSAGDVARWEALIARSAQESGAESPEVIAAHGRLLREMQRFAGGRMCRHRFLKEYFGQKYEAPECGACDTCLDAPERYEDSTVTAQKILSCVARTEERFGVGHVLDVLLGANTAMVRQCRHEQLSTFGLLRGVDRDALKNMVYQLVDQGVLERTAGDRPIVKLNRASWDVMGGRREVLLYKPATVSAATRREEESWEGVDRGLFEALRAVRRTLAEEERVPPFTIASDALLRELAAVRPTTAARLARVRGMGERKAEAFGARLIAAIREYCEANGVAMDQPFTPSTPSEEELRAIGTGPRRPPKSGAYSAACLLFAKGAPVDDVCRALNRAPGTVWGYLSHYLAANPGVSIDRWAPPALRERVMAAVAAVGDGPAKPIFEHLGGQVPYEVIRLARELARRDAQPEAK